MESISKEGLLNPFLTNLYEIAEYYATCSCEDIGGSPIILELEIPEDQLCYDGAAMDEPVLVAEEQRDTSWEKAKDEHPDWIVHGFLCIPEHAFQYSLIGVNSVWAKGVFFVSHNKNILNCSELEAIVEKIHRNQSDLYDDGDLLERINCVDFYELMTIQIEDLDLNEWTVDEELVESYMSELIETMPPIIIHEYSPSNYSIVDGIHRLNVCHKLGLKTIKAYVGKRA